MLWKLIGIASPRRFWWVPITCFMENWRKYPSIIIKYPPYLFTVWCFFLRKVMKWCCRYFVRRCGGLQGSYSHRMSSCGWVCCSGRPASQFCCWIWNCYTLWETFWLISFILFLRLQRVDSNLIWFVTAILTLWYENMLLNLQIFLSHLLQGQECVSRRCLWHNLTYVQTLS